MIDRRAKKLVAIDREAHRVLRQRVKGATTNNEALRVLLGLPPTGIKRGRKPNKQMA